MELARHNGICAECCFPFSNHFVYAIFREGIPEMEETSPFSPKIMSCRVVGIRQHLKIGNGSALNENAVIKQFPNMILLNQKPKRLEDSLMKKYKIIVEKHTDGYVAYPLGLKGVVVGQGDTYEEALSDVKSAIRFHIESFGEDVLEVDPSIIEAFIAEAGV